MTYRMERLADEPILISTMEPPLSPEADVAAIGSELEHFLADMGAPIHLILDLSEVSLSFSQMVMMMGAAASRQHLGDGSVRMVLVGSNPILKLGAESARQEQYGGVHVAWYATREEALTYVREVLAAV